jgi:hypothetical protein
MLPPGTYYVGDLCYVFNGEKLDKVADAPHLGGGLHEDADGMLFYEFQTSYGDGEYVDHKGRKYPVDAGSIGCVDAKHIVKEDMPKGCGHIITFTKPFKCSAKDGRMLFGHVLIDTRVNA